MTKKPRKPPLVEAEWIDAVGYSDMHGVLGEILQKAMLMVRYTSGLLLYQDETRTVLAHDYDPPERPGEPDEFGNLTVIPTGWVRKVRYLERKPKEEKDGESETPDAASKGPGDQPADGGNPGAV